MEKITKFILVLSVIPLMKLSAQESKIILAINTGISIPSIPDRFSNNWKTGIGGCAGIGLQSGNRFQLIFDFAYYSYQFNENNYATSLGNRSEGLTLEDGSTSIITVNIKMKPFLLSNEILSVYWILGLGYSNIKENNLTVRFLDESFTIQENSFGAFNLIGGAGMQILLNDNLAIFAEGCYSAAFSKYETTGFIPLSVGLNIKF
jgi:opacity protein-like surface antigen